MDGFFKDAKSTVVFLVGQLGRDIRCSESGFGRELFNCALNYLFEAQNLIGCRYCLIETENSDANEKVIGFYKDLGFAELQDDNHGKYKQVILRLK